MKPIGIALLTVLGIARGMAAPGAADAIPSPVSDQQTEAFFAGPIRKFELQLSPKQAANLRREPRAYVPMTVTVGDQKFEEVGVHLKGAAGSSRGLDDKPALTLKFDKFKPGQRAFGLEKLHLNNSVQDDSYLNEIVASEWYRRSGLPTARATHVWVTLNGRDLGLYVLKEGYDTLFLKRNFPNSKGEYGNLYDGGFLQDVDQDLQRDSGKGIDDHHDLHALVVAADSATSKRAVALAQLLDVDRFATFLAGQALTDDWDGYGRNRNNYRVYCPLPPGTAVFIPHGMDQLFREPNSSLRPSWEGLVAQRYMEVPEFRERYQLRLRQMTTNVCSAEAVSNQLQRVINRLHDSMGSRPAAERRNLDHDIAVQRRQILRRVASVARQLGLQRLVGATGSEPLPSLEEWEPRPKEGRAVLERVTVSPDVPSLHLVAQKRGTIASFRTTVPLTPGNYTFAARACVRGIKTGLGAGLRISGTERSPGLVGDQTWAPVSFDFALEEERDIELVVELAADAGEAWFDLASLELKRR